MIASVWTEGLESVFIIIQAKKNFKNSVENFTIIFVCFTVVDENLQNLRIN